MGKRKIILGLLLIIGACVLVCIGPTAYQSIRLEYYHHKWKPPQNYEIAVSWWGPGGADGEMRICDGRLVVLQDDGICNLYPELCTSDPVAGLFKLAGENRWIPLLDETTYNQHYGYPKRVISRGIEGSGVIVTDFHILDSCEGQPPSTAP
jgi:hypothetical protein